ncbi:MAG: sensor histidine kinase [Deinococcus sp.]
MHRTIFAVTDPTTETRFGYATVTRDIRERKRIEQERLAWQAGLEQQVAERTQELSDLNAELDAFSYSISHDLRTPIRHVAGFSALLRRALDAGDTSQSERFLGVIEQAAGRMELLVDALLQLARQARQPLRRGSVDLARLVERVRLDLSPDLMGREVSWTLGSLPVVLGDDVLLEQVLVNLLGNALKYTRTRSEARIEVRARHREAEWVIEVSDNGVGFDPQYSEKLFGVFQRLHDQGEFEGIGVGLANVQRIVKRHGGRVWASAVLGEGARFSFTLPG